MADSQIQTNVTRYRPREPGDPSAAEQDAYNTASQILAISDDSQLVGDKAQYRHYLVTYELEKLWDRAQQELLATQRERRSLRGWLARRLEL